MAVKPSSTKRIKLSLTRTENPRPLMIYVFPEEIKCFVVCPCDKNCEIVLFLADGNKHYVDNSPENLKLLGVD